MIITRAMVVNAAQLATYSQAKQAILNSGYIQVILKRYNVVHENSASCRFSGWNLLPLCCIYDLWTCHHHCFHAGGEIFKFINIAATMIRNEYFPNIVTSGVDESLSLNII